MERSARNIMKWAWIALISFACSTSDAQQVSRISNEELAGLMKQPEVQLLDVRTPEEVAHGIIEGATVIDIYDPQFIEKVGKLDKEKPIVVYCAAGGRSAKAAMKLKDLGFKKIYDLKAGYRGWKSEGYPTVKQ